MKIKLLVFDVDGTIFNSESILLHAYTKAIDEYNSSYSGSITIPPRAAIINQLGNPGRVVFKTLFPNLDIKEYKTIGALVRFNLIALINQGKGNLYNGVIESFRLLKKRGLQFRLASNGSREYIEAVFNFYKLADLFGELITLDSKDLIDKGDILIAYKNAMNIAPAEIVMIGDRLSDLLAAEKCGCRFIRFANGHGTDEEFYGTNCEQFNHYAELPTIIEKTLETQCT